MVKVGLIGCGKISVGHVEAFSKIPDAKIVAACDISKENLARVVSETGATPFEDYKEMVVKGGFDLAVITLPHALHNPCTCFCAEHGLDVFVEKPMGISESDCQEMIDVCKKNNVMLWVGHPQKYMPNNMLAKELVQSGEYGKLVGISESRCVNYFSDDRPRWFLDKKMSGGGIMMNLGAHTLDKAKFFTDSEIETIVGSVHKPNGASVEDSGQAFAKMSNGVAVTMNLIGHTAAYYYETILYLSEGEIRVHSSGTLEACRKDGKFKKIECDRVTAMQLQIKDVVKAMKADKKPAVTGEYGKDIIGAIKAVYGEKE